LGSKLVKDTKKSAKCQINLEKMIKNLSLLQLSKSMGGGVGPPFAHSLCHFPVQSPLTREKGQQKQESRQPDQRDKSTESVQ